MIGVLSPPPELPDAVVAAAIGAAWGLAVAELAYAPVGFGSHHWVLADGGGRRWFASVDDLDTRRVEVGESLDAPYGRLRASLEAAAHLRDQGCAFVVAPVRAGGGEVAVRLDDRFAAALYPHLDGESFDWSTQPSARHRDAVLDMLLALHAAPPPPSARHDGFAIPHRDEVAAAVRGEHPPAAGPYAGRTADLLAAAGPYVSGLLDRYDTLVARCRGGRRVLTHGEPHPGNTMRTAAGWHLIDWDTALVALPERDLWMLDPAQHRAYAEATGVPVDPAALDLFRLRWDLADLAMAVSRFRAPHTGSADDAENWDILERLVQPS